MTQRFVRGSLDVSLPPGGFERKTALAIVQEAELKATLTQLEPGPFGLSARGMQILEAVLNATDLGLAASAGLSGVILEEIHHTGSFVVPALNDEQRRFVALFQLVTTIDDALDGLAPLTGSVQVEGSLELDGLGELLSAPPRLVATRALRMARAYATMQGQVGALSAFFLLLRRALVSFAGSSALRPFITVLSQRSIEVGGRRYAGLTVKQASASSQLLPITPEQIVGNQDYVEAGLKLARDVAGYDFDRRTNPKKLNPVLFALGKPGCGKTITAHAIGNAFLSYCQARDIPARFVVVRRSDWASSYQNASATNLVRIFKEEVYGFDGVCGVYWGDIDTAFASREASGLRMEEKQNLGAVFGIFDGTMLPKDGKWFLICDANTMHMDEATISRIAQNPFTVEGPTTPEHYVRLMREIMLADLTAFLPGDDAAWARIGQRAADYALSGRNVDAICGNIRARIQDFEYPEAYFKASTEERLAMLESLCQSVTEAEILEELEKYERFHREAEERATEEQFEREVEAMVRQLNAGRAAAERAAGLDAGTS